jgi:poly-gamma-glutamate synthesis protein (capsule biosynthesis protein)
MNAPPGRSFVTVLLLVFLLGLTARVHTDETRQDDARGLQLAFLGDLMAHDVNYGMRGYHRIYEQVSHLFEASDFVFAQLEFVVDPDRPQSSYPYFNAHPAYVEAAVEAGVNVFSLANNHSADFYEDGVDATMNSMQRLSRRYPISFSGLRARADGAFSPVTLPHEHLRIGFLAVTRLLNVQDASRLVYFVPRGDDPVTDDFLIRLRDWTENYDLFILSVHDGLEYRPDADETTLSFMRSAADAGADIVWGHHPHVLQQWFLHDREASGPALIMPSMGNFVSGQTWPLTSGQGGTAWAATGDSAVVRVMMQRSESGVVLDRVEADLVTHYLDPAGGVTVRPLRGLAEHETLAEQWREFYEIRAEVNQRFNLVLQGESE